MGDTLLTYLPCFLHRHVMSSDTSPDRELARIRFIAVVGAVVGTLPYMNVTTAYRAFGYA